MFLILSDSRTAFYAHKQKVLPSNMIQREKQSANP